ncbi:hypothetical protein FRZ06_03600 [Anoxybacterium hadale]|uniref:Uncharacterized protein n=1 Tax=Anoxybacterium hadale TaxID=3408580 RepID=A0ACD1A801_9FIRM|nr:hypothetical protein FRZ06_03600 [Clostridiales bacterium]
MKRVKSIIGILLIMLSFVSLFLWEWKGREMILLREVLVAKHKIEMGTLVDQNMFEIRGVPKDNLIEGALKPEEAGLLMGKVTAQLISQNSQLSQAYFRENEFYLKEGEAIFVIEPDWIAMRSSSLRRGDIVQIYGSNSGGLIGSYRIAFVKDEAEREVRDVMLEGKNYIEKEVLERTDSTSIIDHVEIITTLEEYEKLVAYVTATPNNAGAENQAPALETQVAASEMSRSLILVQGGEKIDP